MRRTTTVLGLSLLVLAFVLPAGPALAARDTTKPRAAITTPDGAILVGAPVDSDVTLIRGSASDARGSGVRSVVVTFCANAGRSNGGYTCGSTGPALTDVVTEQHAAVRCSNATRRSCTWTARAPVQPGSYLVFATAVDAARNRRSAGPILITVV